MSFTVHPLYNYHSGTQRTKQACTAADYVGLAFQARHHSVALKGMFASRIVVTYDEIGQLRSAQGKELGGASRLQEKLGYSYDAAGNLQYRTNNALIQTFSLDSVNQISAVSRSGTFTVAGGASGPPSAIHVNGSAATIYADNAFAKDGLSLTNGANSFTATGSDANGRTATNTAAGSFGTSISLSYDSNGNLLTEGDRRYSNLIHGSLHPKQTHRYTL